MTAAANPYAGAARRFKAAPRRDSSPLALAKRLEPRTGTSAALRLIDQALVDLIDGRTDHDALVVMIPPQEAKSTTVARRFPEWLLEIDPAKRVAIVSYELETALRWGRDIKRDIELAGPELPVSIRADSSAAGRWETPQGGGVYSVGVGGPLTGRPVDVLGADH